MGHGDRATIKFTRGQVFGQVTGFKHLKLVLFPSVVSMGLSRRPAPREFTPRFLTFPETC
jgi:hypothetical protein